MIAILGGFVFYWPFDHWIIVLALLGVIAAALGLLWKQSKNRRYGQALAGVAGLLAVFFLLRLVIETPSQQIVRKLQEMSRAVKAKDTDGVVKHVSDEFKHGTFLDKGALTHFLREAIDSESLREAELWRYDVESVSTPADGKPTATVSFYFKGKGVWGETVPHWLCKATFVRDADGQWRLKDFETPRDSVTGQPITVPGIGQ